MMNNPFKIRTFRDLTLLPCEGHYFYVIACDSCGGVGIKSHDVVSVPPEITGYYTASVTLSEIISLGAKPLFIINTLCSEMNDTGNEINKGIKRALKELALEDSVLITGSTEENIPMVQTALGLTAVGIIDNPEWTFPQSREGWHLYAAGIPKVGEAVLKDGGVNILTLVDYQVLSNLPFEKDLLPVGSKGIKYEADLMAQGSNLTINWAEHHDLDLSISAGPATCAVMAINKSRVNEVKKVFGKKMTYLGTFII